MQEIIKITSIKHITHDVLRIRTEKPANLQFISGQAADISIHSAGWENEIRAFTFTSLPDDDFIEFTIKTYPAHGGVTNKLLSLSSGDKLMISGVFGDIHYKGEGIFIAGGAGITPFLSIFKKLEKENKIGNNKLIFANKTKADIIDEEKLNTLLKENFINVLSDENITGYEHGFISSEIIKNQIQNHQYFYLCGPPPMMDAVSKHFKTLNIPEENIIKEAF